jgi:proteic killer suppression protein
MRSGVKQGLAWRRLHFRAPYPIFETGSSFEEAKGVQILFRDEKLRKECRDFALLQKQYGQVRAKRLWQRIQELASAKTLQDMRSAPGRCHELHGTETGRLSLELNHHFCLIFSPSPDQPKKPEGGVDWEQVRAVEVIGLKPR